MDGERPSYGPRLQRLLFFVSGSIFVALATLGVLLPLLPTTPFLLLAAACYARSSSRFHSWLLANRIYWADNPSMARESQHRPLDKAYGHFHAHGPVGFINNILCAAVALKAIVDCCGYLGYSLFAPFASDASDASV